MSDYYKVDFSISPRNNDAADLLAAFLADAGFESFVETDEGISAFVQSSLFEQSKVEEAVGEVPFDVRIEWKEELIKHRDWNEEWEKNYFRPQVLGGGRCVVHSSFHKDYPKAELDILVDPKMAFGTGHHATTSMMAEFLFETDVERKSVMDMGTGTGILAIIARKLGANRVSAIEIDPCAYENALENISLNKVEVLLLQGDATLLPGLEKVDVFLANINRNIIINDMKMYVEALETGGTLLLSGFYLVDIPMVEASLHENGMKIADIKHTDEGNWVAVKAVRLP